MKFALIGHPVGHSFSKDIHSMLGSYEYVLLDVLPEKLESVLADETYCGFNVTIPYKRDVLRFCASLSPEAAEIGSVNTVVRQKDGSLRGYNTDRSGFIYMLHEAGIDPSGKKCAVFGTGGASMAVISALKSLNAYGIVSVSRTGVYNYNNVYEYADSQFLINCTPVGMSPDFCGSAFTPEAFPNCCAVADVVYNPMRTSVLQRAAGLGIKAAGGLPMLVAQAVEAAVLFTGNESLRSETGGILSRVKRDRMNIVIAGMPGSGKTTVGKAVAELLGRAFIDTDDLIEKKFHKNPEKIIENSGEKYFRAIEADVVASLAPVTGAVIATGGGTGLLGENRTLLSGNGMVFVLRRGLENLTRSGRPLSVDVSELFEKRRPMYESWADAFIDNNGSIDDAVRDLVAIFNT